MATFGEWVDFASIMLCMTSFSCLFVTLLKKNFRQVCWSVAFVCPSVCHTIFAYSSQAIVLKFICVCLGDRPRTAMLNFGEDPNPDPYLIII